MVDFGGAETPVHCHDWPILSLYVMGRQTKIRDGGEKVIAGPAAILHPAGAPHANRAGEFGLEQIDIEFDPAWLGLAGPKGGEERVQCWIGGAVGTASRVLASEWRSPGRSEAELAALTRAFLGGALAAPAPGRPAWLDRAVRFAVDSVGPVDTRSLARQLGLGTAWLAQAYRRAMGEGLQQTAERSRLERAVRMLRESSMPSAEIAAATGFCDQSHMIRACTRLLGRRPTLIREEGRVLGPPPGSRERA